MKKLYQFRYYGQGNENNFPADLNIEETVNLLQNYPRTTQLGIQSWPGAKFSLNEGNNPIEVGMTGIYELDLDGLTYLYGLYFDQETLNQVSETKGIIIDLIYEGE